MTRRLYFPQISHPHQFTGTTGRSSSGRCPAFAGDSTSGGEADQDGAKVRTLSRQGHLKADKEKHMWQRFNSYWDEKTIDIQWLANEKLSRAKREK